MKLVWRLFSDRNSRYRNVSVALRTLVLVFAFATTGFAEIAVDRTSSSAWYYERYEPRLDQIVELASVPARVLIFEDVHFAIPLYSDDGEETGHADGWRMEVEVFFSKNQLPANPVAAATSAIKKLGGNIECPPLVLEEHPHYVRMASGC